MKKIEYLTYNYQTQAIMIKTAHSKSIKTKYKDSSKLMIQLPPFRIRKMQQYYQVALLMKIKRDLIDFRYN